MEYRIIIAGSRTFDDYERLEIALDQYLYNLLPYYKITIISGCAKGADALGERYAQEHGLPVIRCKPEWRLYKKGAPHRRNELMAMIATDYNCRGVLFAFWDGKSRGTKSMLRYAEKFRLEIHMDNYINTPQ